MKLQGILGGGTGKLGESVFTNNAGRTIVRQYNPHVRNPRTVRQQNSRERFKLASELAKNYASVLPIGLPRIGALTSRNRFTSAVIPVSAGVITKDGSEYTIEYGSLPLSKGGMPVPSFQSASAEEAGKVQVTYTAPYNPTSTGYVPPMPGQAGIVIVIQEEDSGVLLVEQSIDVTSGTIKVTVPASLSGLRVNVWAFAKWVPTAKNDITTTTTPWKYPSDQSDTSYLGTVVVI